MCHHTHDFFCLIRCLSTQAGLQRLPEHVSSTISDTTDHAGVVRVSEGVFQSRLGRWQVVVGLEVHAQIRSASKLFSGSRIKCTPHRPSIQCTSLFSCLHTIWHESKLTSVVDGCSHSWHSTSDQSSVCRSSYSHWTCFKRQSQYVVLVRPQTLFLLRSTSRLSNHATTTHVLCPITLYYIIHCCLTC